MTPLDANDVGFFMESTSTKRLAAFAFRPDLQLGRKTLRAGLGLVWRVQFGQIGRVRFGYGSYIVCSRI